jgi:hypothetical protein
MRATLVYARKICPDFGPFLTGRNDDEFKTTTLFGGTTQARFIDLEKLMNLLYLPFFLGLQELLLWAIGKKTICLFILSRFDAEPYYATVIERFFNPGFAIVLLLVSSLSVADEVRLVLFRLISVRRSIAVTRLATTSKILVVFTMAWSVYHVYAALARGGTLPEIVTTVYANGPFALLSAGAWMAVAFSSSTSRAYDTGRINAPKLQDGTSANILLTIDGQRGEKRLYAGTEYVAFATQYKVRPGISGMISQVPVVYSESYTSVKMPYNFCVTIEIPDGLEAVLPDEVFAILRALIEPQSLATTNAIDHIKTKVSSFHLSIEQELRKQAGRITSNADRLLLHASAVPFLDDYLRDTEDVLNSCGKGSFTSRITVTHNMLAMFDADARAEYQLAQQKIMEANNIMLSAASTSTDEFNRKRRVYEQALKEAVEGFTVKSALSDRQREDIVRVARQHLILPGRPSGTVMIR